MRHFCYMVLLLLAALSCSVKEIREDCPCYLGLTVTSQSDTIFQNGKAWCGIFNGDGSPSEGSILTEMDVRDTTVFYGIDPRRTVSAVVSNREIVAGKVVVPLGSEMTRLFAFRQDFVCTPEFVDGVIDSQDKQYCTLDIHLTEAAMPFAPQLVIRIDAPYNGTSFPSMEAHFGEFQCRAVFDVDGRVSIRIPRQGGEGARLIVRKANAFTATYDLYADMAMSGYDWNGASMEDFSFPVGLNSITGTIEILDWTPIEMGNYEF